MKCFIRKNRQWQLYGHKLGNRCECHGSPEIALKTDDLCHGGCGMLKNPHCIKATNSEYSINLAPLRWQWWRFHKRTILKWDKTNKTNKIFLETFLWKCITKMEILIDWLNFKVLERTLHSFYEDVTEWLKI